MTTIVVLAVVVPSLYTGAAVTLGSLPKPSKLAFFGRLGFHSAPWRQDSDVIERAARDRLSLSISTHPLLATVNVWVLDIVEIAESIAIILRLVEHSSDLST
jgi:hypothetical protein